MEDNKLIDKILVYYLLLILVLIMKKKNTYLYVILLPQMNEELELGYMIKFGYTKDFKDRMRGGYNQYHRYVKVLHIYEGEFTMMDESKLKQYFRDNNLVLCKDEYLKNCNEVLEFFNTYDTSEKLKEKIDTIPYKPMPRKYYKVDLNYIEYIIFKIYSSLTELLDIQRKRDEIFKELREFSEKEQLIHIKTKYGITEEELEGYVLKVTPKNSTEKACEMAIEFNNIGDTSKKLRMLVDLREVDGATEKDINSFLELIPPKFKEYYTIMGPDFIKQFSCNEAEIKKEWIKQRSNKTIDIASEIYKIFEVGERYTKADIKATLKKLYSEVGYQKTAKASDLQEYFEVKGILTSDKKNGFELLKKK